MKFKLPEASSLDKLNGRERRIPLREEPVPKVRGALAFAAAGEITTGVALLLAPTLVGQWLFGVMLVGIAMTLARLAGIALIGLGVACWPGRQLLGMLTYSVAAALYLTYVGSSGGPSGILLWPAVGVHVVLAALLSRGISRAKATRA